MAIKGPQHDEAWLIFMDMVNNRYRPSRKRQKHFTISRYGEPGSGSWDSVKSVWNVLSRRIMQ